MRRPPLAMLLPRIARHAWRAPGSAPTCLPTSATLGQPLWQPLWQRVWQPLVLLVLLCMALLGSPAAQAQGVELTQLRLKRAEAELVLEYHARLTPSPAVEEALQRGVPMYFVAEATLWRNRWYWRDERMARISRTWRVAYQPLTSSWRVSLGGLSQVYGSLAEALAPLSRVSGWHLTDIDKLENGERYYVDFSFRLDKSQLPPPMQIDVGSEYKLGVTRTQRLE